MIGKSRFLEGPIQEDHLVDDKNRTRKLFPHSGHILLYQLLNLLLSQRGRLVYIFNSKSNTNSNQLVGFIFFGHHCLIFMISTYFSMN